ncbi:MAG: tetratricopeptide repeat protein [Pseudomonadota bacterium]
MSKVQWYRLLAVSIVCLFLSACGGTQSSKPRLDHQSMTPDQAYVYALEVLRAGDYEEALPLLERASEKVGVEAEVVANLGVAQIETGDHESGIESLTRALSMAPGNADIVNAMAIAYRMKGDFERAKRFYQQQISRNPADPRPHYNLGVLCELYLNDAACALEHYRQFQKLSGEPDDEVGLWIQSLEAKMERGEAS